MVPAGYDATHRGECFEVEGSFDAVALLKQVYGGRMTEYTSNMQKVSFQSSLQREKDYSTATLTIACVSEFV